MDSDNSRKRPVMIHRAPFGSMERFIAVLLEHCGGDLPLWLAPVQVKVLPISDRFAEYTDKVVEELNAAGIRAELDDRSEKTGKKIRDAELAKVPYMLIIGEKEMNEEKVAVRVHKEGDKGAVPLQEFINTILDIVETQMSGKKPEAVS